ncbi:MAG: helix-turn-helix domain-containing protein [Ruthenibacterium sp.]
MHFGKFEKKLFSVFLALGILLFALPLTTFVFSGVWSSQKEYRTTMQQSVDSQMTFSNLSFSIAFTAMNDLSKNPNVNAWAAADTSAAYYYYATRIFEDLRMALAGSPPVDFTLYITRLDEDSLVITPEATVSKQDFFAKETQIGAENAAEVYAHFRQSHAAMTLPIYKENKLHEIYYITSHAAAQGKDVLLFLRFSTDALFSAKTPFLLLSGEKEIFSSIENEKAQAQMEHIGADMRRYPLAEEFSLDGIHALVCDFKLVNWRVAYLYPATEKSLGSLLLFCLMVFCGLAALLMIVARLLTKVLYRPVRELMQETSATEPAQPLSDGVDEFAILQKNARRLKELHTEIDVLLTEREKTTTLKYARDLLFGTCREIPAVQADFCVSLIEIQSGSDVEIFRYKSALEDCISEIETACYVNCSNVCCAVIVQTDALEKAYAIIEGVLASCDKKADLYATISDVMPGAKNIHTCYKQALQILEYKYLFDKCDILTMPQVKQVDSRMYFYPLQIENSFIQYLVSGSNGAVILFDELIEENTVNRKLPPEITKSFFLALVASIARAFQTLKLTPQELLGRSVDFEYLFAHWNDKGIVEKLHHLVVEMLEAVQTRNKTSDEQLVAEMTEYIRNNYSRDLMLEDLAHAFHISPKYCSALFKKLSDDTFKNYLNRYRIEVAKDILRGNPSVKTNDLCAMVGFNSANSFIRVFNKYTGVTPKAFLETLQKR